MWLVVAGPHTSGSGSVGGGAVDLAIRRSLTALASSHTMQTKKSESSGPLWGHLEWGVNCVTGKRGSRCGASCLRARSRAVSAGRQSAHRFAAEVVFDFLRDRLPPLAGTFM